MSWEPIGFVFFSTLEVFAWYALSMSIFRFKIMDYFWEALFVILLMNLQSFILRNELSLAYLAPLINVLFFTLLYAAVVKISLIGSFMMSIVGLVGFGMVQAMLAILLFGSIDVAQSNTTYGYILQTSTTVFVVPISMILYKFGYGFSFDLEKFRLKYELITILATIILFLISITFILYVNEIWIALIFFVASLLIFLRYAIKKERDM